MKSIAKQTKYLLLALIVVGLQSCIKSGDEYYPMVIGTTHLEVGDPSTLYFELDSGYKLFPKNPENILVYELKANDRVFIQFTDPDEDSAKKELTAKIKMLLNIHTEEIELTQDDTSAEALLEASDNINIIESYIANGFLTLKYSYLGRYNATEHDITLYATQSSLASPQGTLKLYLTHDNKEDKGTHINNGIISFPIENITQAVEQAEKVTITSKTIYSGVQETSVYINKQK